MLDTKPLHELTKNLLDGMTSYMNLGIEDGSFEAYSQEDIDACRGNISFRRRRGKP